MKTKQVKSILLAVFVLIFIFEGCQPKKKKDFDFPPIDNNNDTLHYVFKSGTDGYSCYRIPEITKAPNGDLLTFVEARKDNCDDHGNIDVVMKRSSDDGLTWSENKILVNNGETRCGEVGTLVDLMDPRYPAGRIFMLYITSRIYTLSSGKAKTVREAWYKTSIDNGEIWSDAVNITTSIHKPYDPEYNPAYNFPEKWPSLMNGPASGFQIRNGSKKGRLYVASNHSIGSTDVPLSNYFSNGYYSDDHGDSWQLSPDIAMPYGNESTAAHLKDGSIVQNFRFQNLIKQTDQAIDKKYRGICVSNDGGNTWGAPYLHKELPTPVCQGDMIDFEYEGKYYLLFSHPDSQSARIKMTIFVSSDGGVSWPKKYLVNNGPAAYSAMVKLSEDKVALIYEYGNTGGIVFKSIEIKDIIK